MANQDKANGRFVTFISDASDLVAINDFNGTQDCFIRDLKTRKTTLLSVNYAGTASGNDGYGCRIPILSDDGRFVAFQGNSSDLVANDTNGNNPDTFVRDLKTGKTTLLTAKHADTEYDFKVSSFSPLLSANGRFVAFTNAQFFPEEYVLINPDIWVQDLKTGVKTLVNVNLSGGRIVLATLLDLVSNF